MPVAMKPISEKETPVNEKNAIRHHVGHVKNFTVGRDAVALRHPLLRKPQKPQSLPCLHVDLHKRAAEFAGEDRVATIDGKIGVIDPRALGHSQQRLSKPSFEGQRN